MEGFATGFNLFQWMLEVKFVFEKERVNRNLLDFAAEAVAQQMNNEDDIDNLEIPLTLFDVVYDKFKDVEWVRSYWNFKAELESAKSEIDEREITANVEESKEMESIEEDAAIVIDNEEVQHQIIDESDVSNEHIVNQKNEAEAEEIEYLTDTVGITSPDLP